MDLIRRVLGYIEASKSVLFFSYLLPFLRYFEFFKTKNFSLIHRIDSVLNLIAVFELRWIRFL